MNDPNNGKVHSIIGQVAGNVPTRCSFFMPVSEGESPQSVSVDMHAAQAITSVVASQLDERRKIVHAQYESLQHELLPYALQALAVAPGMRPCGRIVVGSVNPNQAQFTAGSVWPIMRLACIRPQEKEQFRVIVHELAHLAGVGEVDSLTVLLDPDDLKPKAMRMFQHGWRRVTKAPVMQRNGAWDFDDDRLVYKGLYFEEAMAELVELRYGLSTSSVTRPVTYSGDELVFELPTEYDQDVAGWGILMLEHVCPGVARTLVDGARGSTDYPLLRCLIVEKLPGLFEGLYDIRSVDGLAKGTELILKRLNP